MWFGGWCLENCRAKDTTLLLLRFLTWDACNTTIHSWARCVVFILASGRLMSWWCQSNSCTCLLKAEMVYRQWTHHSLSSEWTWCRSLTGPIFLSVECFLWLRCGVKQQAKCSLIFSSFVTQTSPKRGTKNYKHMVQKWAAISQVHSNASCFTKFGQAVTTLECLLDSEYS